MTFRTMRLRLLNLLYPNRCDCCGARIRYDALLCDNCIAELETLRVSNGAWNTAHRGEEIPWDGSAAAYVYAGAARRGVLALKDGHRGFLQHAAKELADAVRETVNPAEIGCVTWVPMNRRRRRMQGFAHAELLGKALAASLGCKARGGLLTEHGCAVRQHQLSAEDRTVYAKLRYQHTDVDLSGQTVLLTDDILTTGSTVRSCSALLREMGAARVYIAAAAYRLYD